MQAQAGLEQLPKMAPHEKAADRMQSGFAVQTFEQNRQGWLDGWISKVAEAGPALSVSAEPLTFHR